MTEKNFEQELIVRDYLARQRTSLANERTLLAYIRTSLYFLVSGTALFEVNKLAHLSQLGYLSFGLSFAFLVTGLISYFRLKKKLKKGDYLSM